MIPTTERSCGRTSTTGSRSAGSARLSTRKKPPPTTGTGSPTRPWPAKSDGRFLYLSYLADRLADETLSLHGIDELPSAEGLFRQLLDDIDVLHAGLAPWGDLFQQHPAAPRGGRGGLRGGPPAATGGGPGGLARPAARGAARPGRGGRPSDGAVSLKLAYALYTLKPPLGSWKGGEERHASFQLGLKGLAEAIAAPLAGRAPRSLHARQALGLIERLAAQGDGSDAPAVELDADDAWTLAHVVAHLQLGGISGTIGRGSTSAP